MLWEARHTREAGLGNDLGEKLGEVRDILAKEVRLENEGLAGMVRGQLTAEEFGFPRDPEGRSLVRVLQIAIKN